MNATLPKDIKIQVLQLWVHNNHGSLFHPGTSAQKVEHVSLSWELILEQICLAGVTGPMQQSGKKELLDDKQSAMKHKEEILQLLEAVCLPKQVTVMHCKGSQSNISSVSLGNQKAVGGNRGSAIALQGPTLLLVLRNHSDPSSRNVVTDYKNPTWETITRIFRGLRRNLSLRTSGRPEAHLQHCSNIAAGTVKQSR